MFIKTGKSLFGNTGLIISLFILLILLYFSYNKCYNNTTIEQFLCETGKETNCTTLPRPDNVRVLINGGTITLNFTLTNITGLPTPSQFVVVLAQYDINKKNTENNKFFLSNEYDLNSSVIQTSYNYETNLCTFVDGIPSCSYVFDNLDISDTDGNLFYYKLGISAVYNNYNTEFITPYNINTIDKMFTLGSSADAQNKQYTDFLSYQKSLNANTSGTASVNSYSNAISTADGQYELIKSQLGNYPDNLVIDSQTTNDSTLSDLIDKSMANGIINLNVKLNDVLPTESSTPTEYNNRYNQVYTGSNM
jgi:hypothetical protein